MWRLLSHLVLLATAGAYARVEEGGAYGPCHVLHGECRNAAEALQCRT